MNITRRTRFWSGIEISSGEGNGDLLDVVDGRVEVVGGWEREIDQGLVLACETKNHVHRDQFRSGIEISGGDGGGDLWNGVDKGVEVVGKWE